jgi:hypothetical protein
MTSLPELIPDVDFLLAMEECTGRDAIKMLRERAQAIKGEHDEISNLVYEAIVSSRHRWKLARSQ